MVVARARVHEAWLAMRATTYPERILPVTVEIQDRQDG